MGKLLLQTQTQTQTEFYSTSIEIKSVTSGCKNNMVENKTPDMMNMHVGRPLLRSGLTAYIEATLGRAHGQEC